MTVLTTYLKTKSYDHLLVVLRRDSIGNKLIKITYKQIPAGITYTLTSLIITAHYTH